MKSSRVCVVACLVTTSLVWGCADREAPTAPEPASLDVSGPWSGRINYVADSGVGQGGCVSESFNPILFPRDRTVSARFATSCHGPFDLTAKIEGKVLVGDLKSHSANSEGGGRVTGGVPATLRQLAVTRAHDDRDSRRWVKRIVVSTIELVR
jgi:hypothetical protein